MRLRVISSLREFDGLASAWREVTAAGRQLSPFLSHDWFACCWRTAGPSRQRELWMLEDAAGPIAFVPFVRWRTRRCGLPVRMLSLLESPDTPFADIPSARSVEEVVPVVLRALRARQDWDALLLKKLPAWSPTLKALRTHLADGFAWREVGREHSPYVAIEGDWQTFLRNRSARFRKTFRHLENRLNRAGTVSVEEHREVEPDSPIFAEVLQVSRESWKGPRGFAMATMEGMPRFFREFTRRASANGWLHLWVLRLDGRAVATEYQIGENGSIHALRADFDASLAELSPGAGLNLRIMQVLFERRMVREYDMGPGSNPYKLRWATGLHEVVTLEACAPTAVGGLLHGLETRVVPRLRRLRDRWRAACA